MEASLLKELNHAAQTLFGSARHPETNETNDFIDEFQKLNDWRKNILDFANSLSVTMEQFHDKEAVVNNEKIQSLIELLSEINTIPAKGVDKDIIIRHRGLSPSAQYSDQDYFLNNDYVISVGDCVIDNQQLDYLIRFGIMDAEEMSRQLKKTFDFFYTENIYIIVIHLSKWEFQDQQMMRTALHAWGKYFTENRKKFGFILDGDKRPSPGLTILADINKSNLQKFQTMVDKVDTLMKQDASRTNLDNASSIYDAIFSIEELRSKLKKSPIEINNNRFIQTWRNCFDKDGRFNRNKFNQSQRIFNEWENAFYIFWMDLKSVLIEDDREAILNCILRFIAGNKSLNEYVDYILKDFYYYPLQLQFSDRDALFVANLLLFKNYASISYDFGHTPGEVLFSKDPLNDQLVKRLSSEINDKWADKFLQKHITIRKNLVLALKKGNTKSNVMPLSYLINVMRELFIFLTLVWGKEFKSIVADTVKAYANPKSELYCSEHSKDVLLPLLQFFQITILCLIKLGDEGDIDLLSTIKTREDQFLSMKGLALAELSSHKKLIHKIMSVVNEGIESVAKKPAPPKQLT